MSVSVRDPVRHTCKKSYIWNPITCACEVDRYFKNIIGYSVVTYNEIIDAVAKLYEDPTKTTPISFNQKRQPL